MNVVNPQKTRLYLNTSIRLASPIIIIWSDTNKKFGLNLVFLLQNLIKCYVPSCKTFKIKLRRFQGIALS